MQRLTLNSVPHLHNFGWYGWFDLMSGQALPPFRVGFDHNEQCEQLACSVCHFLLNDRGLFS